VSAGKPRGPPKEALYTGVLSDGRVVKGRLLKVRIALDRQHVLPDPFESGFARNIYNGRWQYWDCHKGQGVWYWAYQVRSAI